MKYQLEHTELVNKLRGELDNRDCEYLLEMELKMAREAAILSGRLDAIAFKGDRGMIFEVKSSKARAADKVQLMIYMWMVRRMYPRFRNMLLEGLLVYEDRRVNVTPAELDENFNLLLLDCLKDLLTIEPVRKFPSVRECEYCKVEACDERMLSDGYKDESADFIPDFL